MMYLGENTISVKQKKSITYPITYLWIPFWEMSLLLTEMYILKGLICDMISDHACKKSK